MAALRTAEKHIARLRRCEPKLLIEQCFLSFFAQHLYEKQLCAYSPRDLGVIFLQVIHKIAKIW